MSSSSIKSGPFLLACIPEWSYRRDNDLAGDSELGTPAWDELNSLKSLHVDMQEFDLPDFPFGPGALQPATAIPAALYFSEYSTERPEKPFRFKNFHLLHESTPVDEGVVREFVSVSY